MAAALFFEELQLAKFEVDAHGAAVRLLEWHAPVVVGAAVRNARIETLIAAVAARARAAEGAGFAFHRRLALCFAL
jgi:hypothetical protein